MLTYKFKKLKNSGAMHLVSNNGKYRVTALRTKGHVWVKVSGKPYEKRFNVQALTAIHDAVTDFEMKVILLHFYRQARLFGKTMPTLEFVNYADIFGSCFE